MEPQTSLEDCYKKVIELKNNKIKLETLISVEPDPEQKKKYSSLMDDLKAAILNAEKKIIEAEGDSPSNKYSIF